MSKKSNIGNTSNTATEKVKKIMIGSLSGCASLLIILLISSVSILKNDLKETSISVLAFTACILSSLISGFITAKLIKMSGLIYGVASGVPTVILLLILTLVFSGTLGMNFLFAVLSVLISSAIGGILGVNLKRKPKYR